VSFTKGDTKVTLNFRPGMPAIAWGRADSPPRCLCAVCHGPLPEVALRMWRSNGESAALCDYCVEKWIEHRGRARIEKGRSE